MKKLAVVLAICEFLIFAALAAAQPAPAQAPGATIRATASEVLLDIVVRDKHGKPVNNLKASDFEIYEVGARQEVKSFHFVAAREAETQRAGTVSAGRTAQPPDQPRALKSVNLVPIVFYNLDPV